MKWDFNWINSFYKSIQLCMAQPKNHATMIHGYKLLTCFLIWENILNMVPSSKKWLAKKMCEITVLQLLTVMLKSWGTMISHIFDDSTKLKMTSEITTSLNSRENVLTIFQSFFLELYMPTYQYQVWEKGCHFASSIRFSERNVNYDHIAFSALRSIQLDKRRNFYIHITCN